MQRWLKFSKYLRDFGWEPIIYTPENPEAPAKDNSLLSDIPANLIVIKTPIWEPYEYYKKVVGMKKGEKVNAGFLNERKKPGLSESISVWIRGNFFIPDARKFWIKPSVSFLIKYLSEHPVNAMVSTGPPHSMHLIALGVKKKLHIPWLADFRDPWTEIDFYDQLKLTYLADEKHKRLEKLVLANADRVTTVSKNWSNDLFKIGKRKVDVITNGFDPDDFSNLIPGVDTKFSVTHIGSLNKDRNPGFLWSALRSICNENPEFENDLLIQFIGKTDFAVFEQLEKEGLSGKVVKIDYIPHKKVIQKAFQSQVLLLLINNTPNMLGIIPGKIFEYLAAQRPILCIAPDDGDAASIIKETEAGKVIGFGETALLRESILEMYRMYKNGNLNISSNSIQKFSRKTLTQSIAGLLDEISKNHNY